MRFEFYNCSGRSYSHYHFDAGFECTAESEESEFASSNPVCIQDENGTSSVDVIYFTKPNCRGDQTREAQVLNTYHSRMANSFLGKASVQLKQCILVFPKILKGWKR